MIELPKPKKFVFAPSPTPFLLEMSIKEQNIVKALCISKRLCSRRELGKGDKKKSNSLSGVMVSTAAL